MLPLIGIVALAAVLRLYALDFQSFWLDELLSRAHGLQSSLWGVIVNGSVKDVHPPGYPLLMYLTMHTLGKDEIALRLPSALGGILCVVVMYGLGLRLNSRRVGLTAAAMLATHWFAVYYSQENRPYGLLLLGTCLLAYFACRLVQRYGAGLPVVTDLVAFGACGVLLSYLHYFGLMFFACVSAALGVLALRRKAPFWGVLCVYAAAAASYAPWIAVMTTQSRERKLRDLGEPLFVTALKTYGDMSARHPMYLLVLLALGVFAYRTSHQRAQSSSEATPPNSRTLEATVAWLVMWAVVPVALALLVSYTVTPVYRIRNLIIILPAVIGLAALALEQIDQRWFKGLPVAATAAVLALLLDLVVLKSYYTRPTKEPFRAFVQHVIASTAEGESAEIWAQPQRYTGTFSQYFKLLGSKLRVTKPNPDGSPRDIAATLWIMTRTTKPIGPRGYRRVELIRHSPDPVSPFPGSSLMVARYEREKPAATKAPSRQGAATLQ